MFQVPAYAFNSVRHAFWFTEALKFHQCLFLTFAGQKGVAHFLTLVIVSPPPHAPPNLAQLQRERLAFTTSENPSRRMHGKQSGRQGGSLAKLAALLRPRLAGLSCVTCSEKVVLNGDL